MRPVKSSVLAAVEFLLCSDDPNAHTLRVRFPNGKMCEYRGVTMERYSQLMEAPSVGSYFSAHIKPNHEWRYCGDWLPAGSRAPRASAPGEGTSRVAEGGMGSD